ncbi:hypothetical protein [Streptomyces sp. NBC_01262]|uniref:hypothetical protein n=1 Tax=Streptomyces sp. NBC_01262 TaxID=2903803 RepID=UPI003FCCA017
MSTSAAAPVASSAHAHAYSHPSPGGGAGSASVTDAYRTVLPCRPSPAFGRGGRHTATPWLALVEHGRGRQDGERTPERCVEDEVTLSRFAER